MRAVCEPVFRAPYQRDLFWPATQSTCFRTAAPLRHGSTALAGPAAERPCSISKGPGSPAVPRAQPLGDRPALSGGPGVEASLLASVHAASLAAATTSRAGLAGAATPAARSATGITATDPAHAKTPAASQQRRKRQSSQPLLGAVLLATAALTAIPGSLQIIAEAPAASWLLALTGIWLLLPRKR